MLFGEGFRKKFCRMCHTGDLQDWRHRTQQTSSCREPGADRQGQPGLQVQGRTMSSHNTRKTGAPRTPYVPPAARRSANAGNTSDTLSCQQDDSSIGKSRRPSAVGEEGARGLRGANEPVQRAGVVRAGRSPGKGNTSSQRRAQGTGAEGRQARPAVTAATTATTAPGVAPKTTTPGGASPRAAAPNERPSAAKPTTAKLSTPSATEKTRPVIKRDERREKEPRDDFQRQCSVKPAASDTNTCHEPLALEATNTEAPRAGAAGTERARGETDPATGKGRRKPRQAWSQYVPPKRRGSPSSGSATEEAQPALRQPSTAEANAAALRVDKNGVPSAPNIGATSSPPPGDSCSTVSRDAESCPEIATPGSAPKVASPDLTNGAPDLRGANGAIEPENPSTVAVYGATAVVAASVRADHQQQCDDRSAETERSVAESQQLKIPAEETAAASVTQAPSGLPAGHAGAAGSLLSRSDNDCCYDSVDVGASPNQRRAREIGPTDSGGVSEVDTATSSPQTSADSVPAAMAEEPEVPPQSAPARSPLKPSASASASAGISGSSSGGGGSRSSSSSAAARNRAPTSQAARDGLARTESAGGTTSGSEVEAGQTPPELGGDASGGNAAAGEDKGTGDRQELPAAKAPSARYVPPGRRKIIDAEVAACNEGGASGAVGGMGPLWTSRAPIRVSQRARPSDREASPVRPSPTRVARVVSGGMSAYGANISEYSELMSRDQVEACTALVSNFPSALPPGQRDLMLQPFVLLGGLVVWPRPDEALVTFATPALARQAVSNRHNRSSVLLVEALSEAREEKRRGYRRVELARPGRPPADASSASRLISGALGIRRPRAKPSATPARKGAASGSSKGGVRGRGASTAVVQPAESTDSWDM